MDHLIERIYNFLLEYIDEKGDLYYLNSIDEMIIEEKRSLYIDLQHLENFDPVVVDEILLSPQLGLKSATDALKQVLLGKEPEYLSRMQNRVYLRVINPPDRIKRTLRKIRSYALGTLISTEAIVTKSTDVKPYLETATFRCIRCQALQPSIKFIEGEYNPPFACVNATNQTEPCTNKVFSLMKEQSTFIDFQRVSLQEKPEELPSGQMPESLTMFMRDDLCDLIRPGNRVKIVGISESRTEGQLTRGKMPLFNKYVECISIEKESEEYTDIEINDEDEKEIIELSKDPNIHRKIRNSIAPVIYGALEEKEGISYLLFGGSTKIAKDGTKIRGESNILLIGDPGMGKCVHPDTEILLASGERLSIGDYIDKKITLENTISDGYYENHALQLVSINQKGRLEKLCSNIIWKRKSPPFLYKITTASGRRIIVTGTHPFFTSTNAVITSVPAQDMSIGDFIAVPRKIAIQGNNKFQVMFKKSHINNPVRLQPPREIYPWFASFLGLFLAEGYSNINSKGSAQISFTNNNAELLRTYKQALELLNVDYNTRKIENKECFEVYCGSSDLYYFLKAIDPSLVARSAFKRVPNILVRATDTIVQYFLRAIFDGEASVEKNLASIEFTSASYKMLSDIQFLLLRFEILCQITEKIVNGDIYYKLRISGQTDVTKFSTYIGSTIGYKQSRLNTHDSTHIKINTNVDIIPNLQNVFKLFRTENNLLLKEFGIPKTTFMHYEHGNRNPSRQNLMQIVQTLKSHKNKTISDHTTVDSLSTLATSDIFWDKVKKIEKVESDAEWVYDLQVPIVHNFIANNIVVHNSQILKSVSDLVPRGLYTSGRGSSAAGLTAAVLRDPETGEMVLEAGSVVLADKGIVFIDEFDKMRREDRSALHEMMEQHSVSIAKAGIVATLNARTSILAAANPKLGRWDNKKDTIDNLNLPPTIISRFDLIFPLIDSPNRAEDELKASHILKIHQRNEEVDQIDEGLPKELLRKYIAYARKNFQPVLSSGARDEILKFYLELREGKGLEAETTEFNLDNESTSQSTNEIKSIAITPRQLESLIRLSEARAKVALRTEVSREDAIRVIDLFKQTLLRVTKGDIDSLYGMSSQKRNTREIILKIIGDLSQGDQAPEIDDILRKGREKQLEVSDIRDMVDKLLQNGDIYEPRPGQFKRMD